MVLNVIFIKKALSKLADIREQGDFAKKEYNKGKKEYDKGKKEYDKRKYSSTSTNGLITYNTSIK